MSEHAIIVTAAICRLAALGLVMFHSIRHRDWLGIAIGLVWSGALFVTTFTSYKLLASLIATPLVYLVAWGIIKRQRGHK